MAISKVAYSIGDPTHGTGEQRAYALAVGMGVIEGSCEADHMLRLAEGKIDVYPRFNGTKEWDTAASHIICNEAGCKIIDIKTKHELLYNKREIKNNFFISSRADLTFL